jgi:hypothetical protein
MACHCDGGSNLVAYRGMGAICVQVKEIVLVGVDVGDGGKGAKPVCRAI